MMLNSAFAGMGNVMRINPLFSSRLYAVVLASSVETSALGQLAPSIGRKIGSVPCVDWNRCCRFTGVMLHPSLAT